MLRKSVKELLKIWFEDEFLRETVKLIDLNLTLMKDIWTEIMKCNSLK